MGNAIYNYRMVKNHEHGGHHYVVHHDAQLFLTGFTEAHEPVWSNDLQDSAIYCRESAELIAADLNAQIDLITVDLNLEV